MDCTSYFSSAVGTRKLSPLNDKLSPLADDDRCCEKRRGRMHVERHNHLANRGKFSLIGSYSALQLIPILGRDRGLTIGID